MKVLFVSLVLVAVVFGSTVEVPGKEEHTQNNTGVPSSATKEKVLRTTDSRGNVNTGGGNQLIGDGFVGRHSNSGKTKISSVSYRLNTHRCPPCKCQDEKYEDEEDIDDPYYEDDSTYIGHATGHSSGNINNGGNQVIGKGNVGNGRK